MKKEDQLRFPVGQFKFKKRWSDEDFEGWVQQIEEFPFMLEEMLEDVEPDALSWPYRPEGWNAAQVIHHCADSHMNSYIRFKLALTEDEPAIKPYFEDRWAELPDGKDLDVGPSVELLKALHRRWVAVIEDLSKEQLKRTFKHPEHGTVVSLAENTAFYAWHCAHHLAHVVNGTNSKGQFVPAVQEAEESA